MAPHRGNLIVNELNEIEAVDRLIKRARTLDFNDPKALTELQNERDRAVEQGLVDRSVSMKILLVLMERLQAGDGDEACEKMFGIRIKRNGEP
jgi:hypothetical protein